MTSTAFANLVLIRLEWAIFAYFVLINSFYAILLLSATREIGRYRREMWGEWHVRMLSSAMTPRISILAPAYNEAAIIHENAQALLTLSYPHLEVVIVNDGSKDATLSILKEHFKLVPVHPLYWREISTKPVRGLYRSHTHPNLLVVDKENGGKADALNTGLHFVTGALVCVIDADTFIEPDGLLRMVQPFLMSDEVLAAGGTIRVVNGAQVQAGRVVVPHSPHHWLAGVQAVEYLRAFLFGRLGWNRLGGNLIISGAFGLFRRDAIIAAGGYAEDTVGEDIELILWLRRRGYEEGGPHWVEFIPDPVAWTEAPASLKMLGRQRDRWHRGLADALWRHSRLLFNPRYGGMGLLAFPYFFLVELLAPVIELIGLLGLIIGLLIGALNISFALLFFAVVYGYGLVLSALILMIAKFSFHPYERVQDRLWLLLWAVLEPFGYRQLTVFWRLRGLVKFFQGRLDWGAMERHGFQRTGNP